jgi:hypothetical protein
MSTYLQIFFCKSKTPGITHPERLAYTDYLETLEKVKLLLLQRQQIQVTHNLVSLNLGRKTVKNLLNQCAIRRRQRLSTSLNARQHILQRVSINLCALRQLVKCSNAHSATSSGIRGPRDNRDFVQTHRL